MFQSLRPNSMIYVLHKNVTPHVEIGTVISVSTPMTKFPMPTQQPYNPSQPFGGGMEMVVDVVAKINEQTVTFQKLPANKDVEDSATHNIIITTSRDAMNSELMARRQRSVDIVNSAPYHSNLIEEYDKIYKSINPEVAEQQKRDMELDELRGQVAEIAGAFKQLMATLQREKQTTKSIKQENYESDRD